MSRYFALPPPLHPLDLFFANCSLDKNEKKKTEWREGEEGRGGQGKYLDIFEFILPVVR
jgi:hypothetical protein